MKLKKLSSKHTWEEIGNMIGCSRQYAQMLGAGKRGAEIKLAIAQKIDAAYGKKHK